MERDASPTISSMSRQSFDAILLWNKTYRCSPQPTYRHRLLPIYSDLKVNARVPSHGEMSIYTESSMMALGKKLHNGEYFPKNEAA